MKISSHKENVTNITFSFETSPNRNHTRKSGGTWHIMSPRLKKWRGHVLRVPHQIHVPMTLSSPTTTLLPNPGTKTVSHNHLYYCNCIHHLHLTRTTVKSKCRWYRIVSNMLFFLLLMLFRSFSCCFVVSNRPYLATT